MQLLMSNVRIRLFSDRLLNRASGGALYYFVDNK